MPFKAVAGAVDIACGVEIPSLGSAGTTVTVADFRLFIHDVKLVTDEGVELDVALDADQLSQSDRVVQLDFRDTVGCVADADANPNHNNKIIGTVTVDPALVIDSVRFTLGVPFDLNHANQADAVEPLRNPGLASGAAWAWQAGYKFTGLDVFPVGGVSRPGDLEWSNTKWNIHLGSTGCAVTTADLVEGEDPLPCAAPNRVVITLPLGGRNLGDNAAVKIDYAALVETSNLSLDNGLASGCMSGSENPECEEIFARLGLPWGENAAVENAATDNGIFSVVSIPEA
ncbi:MAG: metallo-mystery pair system four-Cys motif protein [Gammaproteobacteria bacterium HGW-Gammaproteobacteria-14]|nr:MAG: metallo-mystery pair system four-Cys motif protein [Gammaproteobacteria bacterium HGW-Gammaproteobacteria-14]